TSFPPTRVSLSSGSPKPSWNAAGPRPPPTFSVSSPTSAPCAAPSALRGGSGEVGKETGGGDFEAALKLVVGAVAAKHFQELMDPDAGQGADEHLLLFVGAFGGGGG